MNKLAVQRQSRPLLPELSELFNGFPTFASLPSIAGLRPFFDHNLMRVEDDTREGLYQVRAELPGVDPIEDIEVTVLDGQLTIRAERAQTGETNGRSEFSYGSFARTIVLPVGADEDDINETSSSTRRGSDETKTMTMSTPRLRGPSSRTAAIRIAQTTETIAYPRRGGRT